MERTKLTTPNGQETSSIMRHPIRAQTPTPVSAPCGRVRKYRQPGCRYSRPPAPSLSAIPHSAASSSRQIPPPPPVKHPGANTIHGDLSALHTKRRAAAGWLAKLEAEAAEVGGGDGRDGSEA
ncbi:hypothetical protein V9T40_006181 [Parthenolecanium corni]|uniref:Uncharacterized protein n=1 Tax=Parthenolecanium corni TaxID=536013 RepID=A0AAN9TTW2_9HEMI